MDVYFSDQVNDPSLRLFSSTKTLKETLDDSVFEDDPIIASAIAAATSGAYMDIDELIRRQKERAALAAERKLAAAASGASGDYKFELKPMLSNSKFNSNSDMAKLSKSVDDRGKWPPARAMPLDLSPQLQSANPSFILAQCPNRTLTDFCYFCFAGEAEKVKSLIRLRAELSPLFTGKRNASKYAWA